MPTSPRVSVILTSYNHEKYLRQAIESVLAQTFRDFELIIWDDGSVDDSWKIINSYSDPRIHAFRNEVNLQDGTVRWALAQAAPAEYVAVQHSDDVWEPEKLERQVALLDENPHVGAVFTWVKAVESDGSLLEDETHSYHHIFDQPDRSRHQWLNYFFFQGNALCHPSVMLRRRCFVECGSYRPGMAQLRDLDLWVRLCLKYEIRVLPERLVRLRVPSSEVNSSGNRPEVRVREQFEYLQVLENYRELRDFNDLVKVFPSAGKYVQAGGIEPNFALAMIALEPRRPFYDLFGLNLLFEALNDPERGAKLRDLYRFQHGDFFTFTGERDIFGQEQIRTLDARIGLITEQNNQLSQQNEQLTRENVGLTARSRELDEIKLNRAWSLITRLQRLRLRMIPIGSRRERLLRFVMHSAARIALPQNTHPKPLSPIDVPVDARQPLPAPPSIPMEYAKAFKTHETAVILHLYYPKMWQDIAAFLSNLGDQVDLYVTAPPQIRLPEDQIRKQFPGVQIYRCENRGRDIAPFLTVFSRISDLDYKYVCKLHTKKSPQIDTGSEWRQDVLGKLLGSPEIVLRIKNEFDQHPDLGIVAPKGHVAPHNYFWKENVRNVTLLARRLGIAMAGVEFSYVAGSMFWFRPAALAPILKAGVSAADFEPEAGQLDGTLAHAYERIFGLVAVAHGYKIAESGFDAIQPSEISFQFRMAVWALEQREKEIQYLRRRLLDR